MVGRLLLALALLCSFAPSALAQTSDPRNRAVIVLDASKSMNEDAGNGGTRLDAAKKAVGTLVDRLPEGVPLGLRVYGSKVSEVSRSEGCQDTELTVPVGPLDKNALTGPVDALQGKGRTPIGRSLLAVPDDLGAAEGRRSVVLITDGGDNCAPPDPCKAAERVAKRGVDLSISVVGFQVNERVQKQLRCIAAAGGGSYVGVDDADKLGDELLALLSRAFRSYEPAGTKVTGGPTRDQAVAISPGLYQDVLPNDATKRWFSVDVPAGQRLVISGTAIPPLEASGRAAFQLWMWAPGETGDFTAFESNAMDNRPGVFGSTYTESVRMRLDDPPGHYVFMTQMEPLAGDSFSTDIPVELAVWTIKRGDPLGAVAPGKLATPTPTATAKPRATATPAPPPPDDSSDLGAWLLVAGLAVAGLAVGWLAAAVLSRRAAA
ncbi:MAG TPA: VWA domain-containing protein [Solirubrobacter sp.]